MKIINKPRGTGKTVELIHVSEVTGARIITHISDNVVNLTALGLRSRGDTND